MLYIFGGLPGTGKTTLAKALAQHLSAAYLRIDRIEQTLRDQGFDNLYDQGYQIAFALAEQNLKLGLTVVADSTNPVEASRKALREAAQQAKVGSVEIEVICSDSIEHKRRIATRKTDIPALVLPSWYSVLSREYHTYTGDRLVIDTAGKTAEESGEELINLMAERAKYPA